MDTPQVTSAIYTFFVAAPSLMYNGLAKSTKKDKPLWCGSQAVVETAEWHSRQASVAGRDDIDPKLPTLNDPGLGPDFNCVPDAIVMRCGVNLHHNKSRKW